MHPMVSKRWSARMKMLSGLEGLLEIVNEQMTMKSVRKSWREWVSDFRSHNTGTAGAKRSANKHRTDIRMVFDNLREWVEWWACKAEYR